MSTLLALAGTLLATFLRALATLFAPRPSSLSLSLSLGLPSSTKVALGEESDGGAVKCPYDAEEVPEEEECHAYHPPPPGASRSPCPALNAMANHGYLPRHGHSLTATHLITALQTCYNLSRPLACALTYGAFLRLGVSPFVFAFFGRELGKLDLHDLARAGYVEHDASLVHARAPTGARYAPVEVDRGLFDALVRDARDDDDGAAPSPSPSSESGNFESDEAGQDLKHPAPTMTARGFARARVRREEEEGTRLQGIQRVVALGECALVLQLFSAAPLPPPSSTLFSSSSELHVPISTLTSFFLTERLPPSFFLPGSARAHGAKERVGLRSTVRWAAVIGIEVLRLRYRLWWSGGAGARTESVREVKEEVKSRKDGVAQLAFEEAQDQEQRQERQRERHRRERLEELEYTPTTTPELTPTSSAFGNELGLGLGLGLHDTDSDSDSNSDLDEGVCFERGVEPYRPRGGRGAIKIKTTTKSTAMTKAAAKTSMWPSMGSESMVLDGALSRRRKQTGSGPGTQDDSEQDDSEQVVVVVA